MSGAKLWRRIWNSIAAATITQVNDDGPVMLLQLKIGYLENNDQVPAPQQFGFASVPPLQSDGVAVFVGGDRSNGVAIGTNHQATRFRGKQPGESVAHNAFGVSIYLSKTGLVVDGGSMPIIVNNATTLTINASTEVVLNTPKLKVSGDIQDNFGSNGRTVAEMRTVYNAHGHGGVQAGGATTATPNGDM